MTCYLTVNSVSFITFVQNLMVVVSSARDDIPDIYMVSFEQAHNLHDFIVFVKYLVTIY